MRPTAELSGKKWRTNTGQGPLAELFRSYGATSEAGVLHIIIELHKHTVSRHGGLPRFRCPQTYCCRIATQRAVLQVGFVRL